MNNQLPPDIVIAVRHLSQALGDPTQVMARIGDSVEATMIKLAADQIKESNKLTLQQITRAFEAWENEYRDDPSSFMSPDECAALEVATLSEQRAIYLTAIFRNLGYQTALIREVVREVIAEPVQQIVSQVSQTREQWLAVREGHFNAAAEEYFSARPMLNTPGLRRIFYAGHCKGYDAASEAPAQQDREALARAMADKLMVWKLPENFGPDCFITFDRDMAAKNPHCWPVGTNLFTHEQAVQMLLDIMPASLELPATAVVQVPKLGQIMAVAKAIHRTEPDPDLPSWDELRQHDIDVLRGRAEVIIRALAASEAPATAVADLRAAVSRIHQHLKDGDCMGASLALVEVEKWVEAAPKASAQGVCIACGSDNVHAKSCAAVRWGVKQAAPEAPAPAVAQVPQRKPCDAWSCKDGIVVGAYDHEGPCSKCNGTGWLPTAPEAPAPATERHLRRLLAFRVGMPHAYYDDGEAHGTEHGIQIDFMREPVADIDAKLRALNVARAATEAPGPGTAVAQVLKCKCGQPWILNTVHREHSPCWRAADPVDGLAAAPEAPAQQCGLCGADQPFTGSCGGGRDNPRALCFATPEAPAREYALNPADVHVQALYKSGGGFSPAVENGVRLTHMPTGIYAECQSEMSKHANREAAWKLLERKVSAKTSPYYISGPYATGEHAGQYGVAEVNTGRIVHFFKPCEFPTCAPHHPCTKPCFRNSGEKQ